MLEFLLQHGADINAKDNRGWTPWYRAAHKVYRDMRTKENKKLVEQG